MRFSSGESEIRHLFVPSADFPTTMHDLNELHQARLKSRVRVMIRMIYGDTVVIFLIHYIAPLPQKRIMLSCEMCLLLDMFMSES